MEPARHSFKVRLQVENRPVGESPFIGPSRRRGAGSRRATDRHHLTKIFPANARFGRGDHRGRNVCTVDTDASPSERHRVAAGTTAKFKATISWFEDLQSRLQGVPTDPLTEFVASFDIIVGRRNEAVAPRNVLVKGSRWNKIWA